MNTSRKHPTNGKNDLSCTHVTKNISQAQVIPKKTVDRQNFNSSQKLNQKLLKLEKAVNKQLQNVDENQRNLRHELADGNDELKSEFLDFKSKSKGRRSSAPVVSLTDSSRLHDQLNDREQVNTVTTVYCPPSRRSSTQSSQVNLSKSQANENVTIADLKSEMPRYLRCRIDEQSEDFDLFSGID
ncbi:hypothetical protein TrispH2_000283 [Trichoplax sp. H2]|nr:hypothetical protein TrispH2_000283 [Trichoplax sp. H2]|eukprot:RDD47421.1 hypothetical protein TrispH2_000283 [Trichoplax sp. H2]